MNNTKVTVTPLELLNMELCGGVKASSNREMGKDILELSAKIPSIEKQKELSLRPVISFCNYIDVEMFRNIYLN